MDLNKLNQRIRSGAKRVQQLKKQANKVQDAASVRQFGRRAEEEEAKVKQMKASNRLSRHSSSNHLQNITEPT